MGGTIGLRSLLAGFASMLLMSPAQAAPAAADTSEPSEPSEPAEPEPEPDPRPYTLDYELGQPIPPGYRVMARFYRAAITLGSVAFGTSYTLSLYFAGNRTEASGTAERWDQVPFDPAWLSIPVLGPFMALVTSKTHDCRNSYFTSSFFYGQCENANRSLDEWRAFLLIDGIVQVLGVYSTYMGITRRWHQLVLTDEVEVHLLPVPVGTDGEGFALVGRFRGF